MNYASFNFNLDLILLFVALGVLIRDYPVRTALIAALCAISYLLPISALEKVLLPPAAAVTESTSDTPTATSPQNTSETVAEHTREMAEGNPSQTASNIVGLWDTVLNGLSQMPGSGGSSGRFSTAKAVEERTGQPLLVGGEKSDSSPSAKPSGLTQLSVVEQQLLKGRLGYTVLRKKEVRMVEQFWLLARCCLLLGAAYFLFMDWRITMGIVSIAAIPIHYYLVLLIFFGTNWQKTAPWWPLLINIGIGIAAAVLIAWIARFFIFRTNDHSFHIPDPNQYRARMGGLEYDFIIEGSCLNLAGITLDLATSYMDPKERNKLRFAGGAAVEFIPRKTE